MAMFNNRLSNEPSKNGQISFQLTDATKDSSPVEVKKSIEVIPDWYKELNSRVTVKDTSREELTIKRCIPVLDVLTMGYYIVTAQNYEFAYNEEKGYHDISGNFSSDSKPITMHPMEQLGGMPFSSEYCTYAYKWTNPYVIKTPKGYSTLISHPANAPYLPFYTLSGVVDTDTYFRPINFPFLMKKDFTGVLPKGTPIAQILPFKREDWSSKVVTDPSAKFRVSQEVLTNDYEKDRYGPGGKEVGGVYKRLYRQKKRYL